MKYYSVNVPHPIKIIMMLKEHGELKREKIKDFLLTSHNTIGKEIDRLIKKGYVVRTSLSFYEHTKAGEDYVRDYFTRHEISRRFVEDKLKEIGLD